MSLAFGLVIGLPLGVLASGQGFLGQIILGVVGVVQTIPSLALLAMLVSLPFLKTDATTAIIALFLYSLLPIVRNTATGLQEIPPGIRESARAMGLKPLARLRLIYLPMASRTILAGIKTSTIINIGTATIAALIGAGGLGQPIISGLNLNDPGTILQGALPAAALAILAGLVFEVVDRTLIPLGLRIRPNHE
jgi:osmoprotectant transport system permease protein